jgi:hypothetical protein
MVESDLNDLAADLAEHMLVNDYQWSDNGGAHVPSEDEILVALRWLIKRLDKEDPGTVIFGGRLAMTRTIDSKDKSVYDVFVHIGELR